MVETKHTVILVKIHIQYMQKNKIVYMRFCH